MNLDISFILPNKDFPDYSVFSNNINSLYFQYSLPYLSEYIISNTAVLACRLHFEELLGKNIELQNEYVEFYDIDNEYFVTQRVDCGQVVDIYILSKNNDVKLFFIRRAL